MSRGSHEVRTLLELGDTSLELERHPRDIFLRFTGTCGTPPECPKPLVSLESLHKALKSVFRRSHSVIYIDIEKSRTI